MSTLHTIERWLDAEIKQIIPAHWNDNVTAIHQTVVWNPPTDEEIAGRPLSCVYFDTGNEPGCWWETLACEYVYYRLESIENSITHEKIEWTAVKSKIQAFPDIVATETITLENSSLKLKIFNLIFTFIKISPAQSPLYHPSPTQRPCKQSCKYTPSTRHSLEIRHGHVDPACLDSR